MAETAAVIFRDFETDGVPSSGKWFHRNLKAIEAVELTAGTRICRPAPSR